MCHHLPKGMEFLARTCVFESKAGPRAKNDSSRFIFMMVYERNIDFMSFRLKTKYKSKIMYFFDKI